MHFPDLEGHIFVPVNLNDEAKAWRWKMRNWQSILSHPKGNPLLDPQICQQMVDDVHARMRKALGREEVFSMGGYMEDRSTLWKGLPYMEKHKRFTHIGVDVNVPAWTNVAVSRVSDVIRVDPDDEDSEGGWGPRAFLQIRGTGTILICAHLSKDVRCRVGDVLKPGEVFGSVGEAPANGNWFPHAHLQVLTAEAYEKQMQNKDMADLDGYCDLAHREMACVICPDPTPHITVPVLKRTSFMVA